MCDCSSSSSLMHCTVRTCGIGSQSARCKLYFELGFAFACHLTVPMQTNAIAMCHSETGKMATPKNTLDLQLLLPLVGAK